MQEAGEGVKAPVRITRKKTPLNRQEDEADEHKFQLHLIIRQEVNLAYPNEAEVHQPALNRPGPQREEDQREHEETDSQGIFILMKESSVKKQREELEDERKLVDEIWDNIIEKVSGGGDNFRSDVYMKCKESLKKQREVLKKEEEELDRQHENMSKIISQIETSGG